jgi:hypothetical protein
MSTDPTLPSSPWPTRDGKKIHWLELFKVHPSAAVFPMMSEQEIKALAADIKKNGMHQLPVFWTASPKDPPYLIDGRNRLEAAMRIDINMPWLKRDDGWLLATNMLEEDVDPVAYVIGINIKRRHLTKKQQADLIVMARRAETPVAEKRSFARGKGSTKDPVKEKVVKDCAASGISEATAKKAWDESGIDRLKITDLKKPPPKPRRKPWSPSILR